MSADHLLPPSAGGEVKYIKQELAEWNAAQARRPIILRLPIALISATRNCILDAASHAVNTTLRRLSDIQKSI